ncbi:MAG: 4'-phosphopantetheinyl transferase superfamily protein [Clostridia bacterium]|nr:4'-phosphopantetheinyl transferase superfamily protein [Clostridia bacterium]
MKSLLKGPVLNVYIAEIPENDGFLDLYPEARNAEIKAINNLTVKREKYYAWKLLELAIRDTLAVDHRSIEFEKTAYGKWVSSQCEFSISHSDGVVAVAVSTKSVGVDIQLIAPLKSENLPDRIFTPRELEEYSTANGEGKNEVFARIWTKKESVFKTLNLPRYFPAEIDTFSFPTYTETRKIRDKFYAVSIAGECVEATKIISNIKFNHTEGDYYVL